VSDEITVPLCRSHHREVHRYGDEAASWNKAGIDPTIDARALWLKTHPARSSGTHSIGLSRTRNRKIVGWFGLHDHVPELQPSLVPVVFHAKLASHNLKINHNLRMKL
jgi:hypothetical protein